MGDRRLQLPRHLPAVILAGALLLIVTATVPGHAQTPAVESLDNLADGVIEEITSPYNHIILSKENGYLVMSFGGAGGRSEQSRRSLDHPEELAPGYTRLMVAGLIYSGPARDLLMLGLGGGTTTTYLKRHLPHLYIQSVELDPAVIAAARKYFGVAESGNYRIHQGDARAYLEDHARPYDLILADVFQADSYIPYHLLTVEFFRLAATRLRPGGRLVLNLHGNNRLFDDVLYTARSVFTTVDTYLVDGNVILIGGDGPGYSAGELWGRAARLQEQFAFHHDIRDVLASRQALAVRDGARLLTDDYSPADRDQALEDHNRSIRY